jgi:hypothetical protein
MSVKLLKKQSPFAIYNAIETLDVQRLDFLLKHCQIKNISGDAYFFMIDSHEEHPLKERIACVRVLLKYYKEPIHNSCTINEIKKIEKKKNINRVYSLLLCIKQKGRYDCMNSDVCEIICAFL